MFRTSILLITALMFASSATAQEAQGRISLAAVAEVEVAVEKPNGEVELKRVPADKVVPGDDVIYTITATNVSDQPVADVVITDPIPKHTVYKDGSAFGDGTAITFSVDRGKTFDAAAKLVVRDADGKTRPAAPADYTHVRWQFTQALAPGASHSVRFHATLE